MPLIDALTALSLSQSQPMQQTPSDLQPVTEMAQQGAPLLDTMGYAKALHPETGLKYSTDTGEVYGTKIKNFRQNINQIEKAISENPNVSPFDVVKTKALPSALKVLPEEQKNKAIQNYLIIREGINKIAPEFGVAPQDLLAQKSLESSFFSKETGNLNFGGVKVSSALRKELANQYKNADLKPNTDLTLFTPMNGISGAKFVQTNEILKADTEQDAIKEAKKSYNSFGQTWKLDKNQSEPKVYKEGGKWRVKINDLFVNYETPEASLEQFKGVVQKFLKKKPLQKP